MPTSGLYHTIHAALQTRLPMAPTSQRTTMSHILVGILHSGSGLLPRIAQAMPLSTSQASKEQRLERFLRNPRIRPRDHFQPLAQQALDGLRGQRVSLLLDRVLLTNGQNVLMVSAAFRRRSVPLAWQVLPHTGASNVADQQAVLATAWALLPPAVRVTVHGDGEFRSQRLVAWIADRGGNWMLGLRNTTLVAWTAHQQGQPLITYVPRETIVYLRQVYLTTACAGPHTVIAWWQRNADGHRHCYAVMTNLPATYQTFLFGRRRMWIETVFRDWQSAGFQLHASRVVNPHRFSRLVLLLAIAYLLFLCIGRYVVKKGWRRRIDTGTASRWQYSLFQLALGWRNHLAARGQEVPILWRLYN